MPGQSKKERIATLREQGFVLARSLIPAERCAELKCVAAAQLAQQAGPLEYEADLRYPGAPPSKDAPGGATVRRLLDAYGREPSFAQAAVLPEIQSWMALYFGEEVLLSRAHHNCVMTKHPAYGSLTGWHRDARYWSFERDDLVSAWLALGTETVANGGLWLVPGSHALPLAAQRFDAAKFFRADLAENEALIHQAVAPELNPGDVLFFHCNTLHSAGQNLTDAIKFSLVFTYHGISNAPRAGSRSASLPEVVL